MVERVKLHYNYLWLNQRNFDEILVLQDRVLSPQLRQNIALHLFKDVLLKVPYFKDTSLRLLGKICMALKTKVYLPHDVVIYKGDFGSEMYIIRKGEVRVLATIRDLSHPILLQDGSFFGEIALVMEVRRTVTVKVKRM